MSDDDLTIDERTAMTDQISAAITSHVSWKNRLKSAIDTGKSEWPPDFVAPCNNCEFGKWLDAMPATQQTEHYRFIHDIHAQFHQEAAEVLGLALKGERDAAERRIGPGSRYNDLTTELIMGAGMWISVIRD